MLSNGSCRVHTRVKTNTGVSRYSRRLMNRQFKFVEKIPQKPITSQFIVLDIESTGLNPLKDTIVGVAFTTKPGVGYYTTDVAGLMNVLQMSKCQIICHNAVFDMSFFKTHGYPIVDTHKIHDTMLLAHLIDPDRETLKLKELSVQLLGNGADAAAQKMDQWLLDNGLERDSIYKAPAEIIVPYAAEDAVNTYEIFVSLCKKITEIQAYFKKIGITADPWQYYMRECVDLIPVVVSMQVNGVKLDLEKTATKETELDDRIKVLNSELTKQNAEMVKTAEDILHQRKIDDRIRKNKSGKLKKVPPRVIFNWDSNDHLKLLFLKLYKVPLTKKTLKGNPSVDSSFLETIKGRLPWVEQLLEYKELKKLKSTYLSSLLERQQGGYIHANYHLAGTATGRFSSSNPNLQNLPKHGGIKSLFVPRQGHKFIYADYSQLELRVAAHLSGDSEMCAEYSKDFDGIAHSDLHQKTADTLKIDRAPAKNINFAIVYNASGWRIADMMGWMADLPLCTNSAGSYNCECKGCVGRKKASKQGDEIIDVLFKKYKGIKLFVDKQKEFMLKYFITVSQFGKIRRLPGLKSELRKDRNHALKSGFNLPIQSFGASLCKRSMVALHRKGYRIVNNVHDALLVEVPEQNVVESKMDIKCIMEHIYPLSVPLVVEPKVLCSFEEK